MKPMAGRIQPGINLQLYAGRDEGAPIRSPPSLRRDHRTRPVHREDDLGRSPSACIPLGVFSDQGRFGFDLKSLSPHLYYYHPEETKEEEFGHGIHATSGGRKQPVHYHYSPAGIETTGGLRKVGTAANSSYRLQHVVFSVLCKEIVLLDLGSDLGFLQFL